MSALPIRLKHSTAGCDVGPIIRFRPGELVVWYDSAPNWTRISFGSCIATRFLPDTSVHEGMVDAYSRIIEQKGSPWISELESHALAQGQTLLSELRHMLVYFDHYGCLEVVARTVAVEENSAPPSQ